MQDRMSPVISLLGRCTAVLITAVRLRGKVLSYSTLDPANSMSIAFTPIFPSVVDALTDVDDGETFMYVGGEGKEEVDEFLLDHIMWCGTIAFFYGTDHNNGEFRGCTAFSYLTDKLVDIHLIYI